MELSGMGGSLSTHETSVGGLATDMEPENDGSKKPRDVVHAREVCEPRDGEAAGGGGGQ
jgi:hypothetical protein